MNHFLQEYKNTQDILTIYCLAPVLLFLRLTKWNGDYAAIQLKKITVEN